MTIHFYYTDMIFISLYFRCLHYRWHSHLAVGVCPSSELRWRDKGELKSIPHNNSNYQWSIITIIHLHFDNFHCRPNLMTWKHSRTSRNGTHAASGDQPPSEVWRSHPSLRNSAYHWRLNLQRSGPPKYVVPASNVYQNKISLITRSYLISYEPLHVLQCRVLWSHVHNSSSWYKDKCCYRSSSCVILHEMR